MPTPSLVQLPINISDLCKNPGTFELPYMMYIIYDEPYCPFYQPQDKHCIFHEDPRRPPCCKSYPFIYPDSPRGKKDKLQLRDNCYLAKPEIFEKIEKKFNETLSSSELELEVEVKN